MPDRAEYDSEVVQSALEEMDYQVAETQFGWDSELSVPCQLRFSGESDQDTERFHEALHEREIGDLDTNPDSGQEDHKPHYDGEVCWREHYQRMRVLVFRGDLVRLYPHDDHIPREEDLGALIEALEVGFGAKLEHDPIESEATA